MKRKSRSGFSLSEVLIAILVLVIGLAGVTAALVYGIRNSTRGKEISDSAQLTRALFEYIQTTDLIENASGDSWPDEESNLNDPPEARRLLNSSPFGGLVFSPQQVEKYRRNIKVERLSTDSNSHRFKLAKVTVKVYWKDEQGEHHSELTGEIRHARD